MGFTNFILQASSFLRDSAEEVTTVYSDASQVGGTEATESVIRFPGLGINIKNLTDGFDLFGLHIAWYGVIIAVGIIVAAILVYHLAKKNGQRADDYIDLAIISVILAIIGARLYYVLFSWDYYSQHLNEIVMIRNGGLAIYGGLIFGIATAAIVCKVKKISFFRVLDTAVPGIVLAQAIGRWGNFMNREAYGTYCDNFMAMQIRMSDANGVIDDNLMNHLVNLDGVYYIQVHPTFFYESLWCLMVFILIMVFRKKAKYRGEVALWYIGGYALGRVWIEGLRTDSLMIGDSGIAISQLLAFVLFFASLAALIVMRVYIKKDPEKYSEYIYLDAPHWQELKYDKETRTMYYPGDREESEEDKENLENENEASDEDKEDATTIYVIRHGETDANKERRVQGWYDKPLNEKGIELALVTGKALKDVKFDLAYSSPLERAKKTAELILSNSGNEETEVVVDDRLKEMGFGDWETLSFDDKDNGISKEDMDTFFRNAREFKGAPNGEKIEDVLKRTQEFLKEIGNAPEAKGKTILVTTHGCAMRAMLNFIYDDPSDFWQGRIPFNLAVNILEVKDGKFSFVEKDKIYYDRSLAREYKRN